MSEKRILRDRAVVLEKFTNVQSTKCVSFKNKPNGKENCFSNGNIKRDDNIKYRLVVETQTHENQCNHKSKKRAAKQNSARKVKLCPIKEINSFNRTVNNVEYIKKKDSVVPNVHNLKQNASSKNSFKSKQTKITDYIKNPILSSVENICTKKVLNTKKRRTETALNLGKVPIWKRDLQVSKSRRKLRHVDVYDISLDEELASSKENVKNQRIPSKKNKTKEKVERKKQHVYSNRDLKSKKKKLLNSKPVATKSVFEIDNVLSSTVKLGPTENDKLTVSEIVVPSDHNVYDNEICVEQNNVQNSFSISSLNDTTVQCGLTDFQFSKPKDKNNMYLSSLSDKSFSVPKMTSTPDAVHSKTGVQTQKNKVISVTDISYTPVGIENSMVIHSDQNEHDNAVCIEQNEHDNGECMEQNDEQNVLSISSLNDTTVQCALADLQFSELKEKNKMYLSNLADEFEKSFSFSKMTSLPAANHSKTRVQTTQKSTVISITDKIPSSSKDCLNTMVTTDVVSDDDVSPQTDKEVEEITLFDSPEKRKTNKQNDVLATSPEKTIQINLFGEVLRTPSSIESSEDSVVMAKKAYHTPDNYKIKLIRTHKPSARTKMPKKQTKEELLIEKLSRHFDEIEDTELCIE